MLNYSGINGKTSEPNGKRSHLIPFLLNITWVYNHFYCSYLQL
jgi:hypothetical protein